MSGWARGAFPGPCRLSLHPFLGTRRRFSPSARSLTNKSSGRVLEPPVLYAKSRLSNQVPKCRHSEKLQLLLARLLRVGGEATALHRLNRLLVEDWV